MAEEEKNNKEENNNFKIPKVDTQGLAAAKQFQDDIAKSLEKQLESSANLSDNQDKLNKVN